MPFVRVVHDKRGYETTYLMELYRDGHRQRSHILYVFRTPGGVRGGREAFDAETRQRIEAHYPSIAFNWNEIREHQQHIEMAPEPRRRRPTRESPEKEEAALPPAQAGGAEAPPVSAGAPRPPVVPSSIDGATPDEQIAFLATWYPRILERIPMRTADQARREALTALCERLNPSNWTDADQIASGLPRAAEALERLSRVFAHRRRRRRRPSERGPSAPDAPAGGEPAGA